MLFTSICSRVASTMPANIYNATQKIQPSFFGYDMPLHEFRTLLVDAVQNCGWFIFLLVDLHICLCVQWHRCQINWKRV